MISVELIVLLVILAAGMPVLATILFTGAALIGTMLSGSWHILRSRFIHDRDQRFRYLDRHLEG